MRLILTFVGFLTAYIGIPIFFLLYGFWKIFKRTKWIPSADADIYTGKAALDAEDGQWPDQKPRNIWEKIWFWIA
jgi:amino acid transporter